MQERNRRMALFHHQSICFLLFFASNLILVAGGDTNNHCNNPFMEVIIIPSVNGVRGETIFGWDASFGGQPSKDASKAVKGPAVLANPVNCCAKSSSLINFSKSVVLAMRGDCAYTDKAKIAEAGGAAGLLVINEEDAVTVMGCSDNDTSIDIKIPVVMIAKSDGDIITKSLYSGGHVDILLYSPEKHILDFSAIFLWMMAIVTIIASSLWSAESENTDNSGTGSNREEVDESVEIQASGAIIFLIAASTVLLVLYFFMSKWFIWVLIVMFCIGGVSGLHNCIVAVISRLFKGCEQIEVDLPFFEKASVVSVVVLPFCILLALGWVKHPDASCAWFIQDILGMGLMISGLRLVKLPNIKVATALLSCAFCYDIFWTFISPYIFKKSVMVEVARSSNTGGRSIPMVLTIPRMFDPWGGTAILGFGDVMLPGLLVAFSYRFDKSNRKGIGNGYFLLMLVGYTVGLGFTYLSLYLMKGRGQPALLYLVPCTLGLIIVMGFVRKEIGELWSFGEEKAKETTFEK